MNAPVSTQERESQQAAHAGQYLTFQLGGETFAIGILAIREIIEYGQVTRMPMTPPYIRGVINLRGAVVPVIDLMVRFGRTAQPVSKRTCIVIAEVPGEEVQQMGIVVDAVNEVLEIPPESIEPAPDFGASIRTDFVEAMGKIDDRFVIVLDLSRVLSMEELAGIVAAAGAGAGGETAAAAA